jgi:hypothetical protein
MFELLSLVFRDCLAARQVPLIWKYSRTVLLYKKGKEYEMKNWRPMSIAGCVYRLFAAMITQWIPNQRSSNKLQIFSRCQKGFVQRQAGCTGNVVLTREMISHVTFQRRDLYMVHIDFSVAFGSVHHDLILGNMCALGLPTTTVGLVPNISTDNRSKVTLTGGETVFNIHLESFLRRIKKDDTKV